MVLENNSKPVEKFTLTTFSIGLSASGEKEYLTNPAYREWSIKNRLKYIVAFLKSDNADIFCLQELYRCHNTIEIIKKTLEEKGYQVILSPYTKLKPYISTYLPFYEYYYLTGFKKHKFRLVENDYSPQAYNFIKNDRRMKHVKELADVVCYSDKYHKLAEFKRSSKEKEIKRNTIFTLLKSKETSNLIGVFNLHVSGGPWEKNDLIEHYKTTASRTMKNIVNKLAEIFSELKIVLAGDFHTFLEYNTEQLPALLDRNPNDRVVLQDVTEELYFSDGSKAANTSFIPYPFDFCGKTKMFAEQVNQTKDRARKEKNYMRIVNVINAIYEKHIDATSGQLDYVVATVPGRATLKPILCCSPGPKDYTEPSIKKNVLKHLHDGELKTGPVFATDHFAIKVAFNEKSIPKKGIVN